MNGLFFEDSETLSQNSTSLVLLSKASKKNPEKPLMFDISNCLRFFPAYKKPNKKTKKGKLTSFLPKQQVNKLGLIFVEPPYLFPCSRSHIPNSIDQRTNVDLVSINPAAPLSRFNFIWKTNVFSRCRAKTKQQMTIDLKITFESKSNHANVRKEKKFLQ